MSDALNRLGGWAIMLAIAAAFLWLLLMMLNLSDMLSTFVGRVSILSLMVCFCCGWLDVYGPRILRRLRR